MKTFTDTEMLDWMIRNTVCVLVDYDDGFFIQYPDDVYSYTFCKTPSEAITAEMNRENNNG